MPTTQYTPKQRILQQRSHRIHDIIYAMDTRVTQIPAILKRYTLLAVFIYLSACSMLPSPTQEDAALLEHNPVASCANFYTHFNALLDDFGVRDAQTTPVAEYPYLHVNRFFSSLKSRLYTPEQTTQWLQLVSQLGLQTNLAEVKNLPEAAQKQLLMASPSHLRGLSSVDILHNCATTLTQRDIRSPFHQQRILANTAVTDNYHTWQRFIGLYPVVALPVAWGIHNWHQRSQAVLQTAYGDLAVSGNLNRYRNHNESAYSKYSDVKQAIDASRNNPLRIPLPDPEILRRLFTTFSPSWEVDTVSNDDKIGAPHWGTNQTVTVNTNLPTVYELVSYTHLQDHIVLQLNYIVWFPARTCTSFLDMLCGHMDGVIWRVTLGVDGKPLLYDSIHNCGCYHTFFPGKELQPLPTPFSLNETAFSPISAPDVATHQTLVLRLAHTTHHIESLYVMDKDRLAPDYVPLAIEAYYALRSLPYKTGQNKSLFQQNALVAGTQRKERWFFWPFGISSAGAMRQWGNHATAFVGRRHFDDPYLIENSFSLKPAPHNPRF